MLSVVRSLRGVLGGCVLGGCVLAGVSSHAMAQQHGHSMNDEMLRSVSEQPQWRQLLHFRFHPFSRRWISQPDSDRFFLSERGKHDPLAELEASVQAFSRTDMPDNDSAQCRFPARYDWLKQQLPDGQWQDQPCSELSEWENKLAAHSLTVIFPASHINSPSSMYGHTLVRLDREDPESSKLLSFSVNFAANADPDDNELVFSYKGLAGGYPGVVSVMPYHVKTREYQHMEYRDVWEYSLNLTPAEVRRFVRHVWELKDIEFDYFFFDENCAYRILAMLDAATERADMAKDFEYTAIPVDTIRAMYQSGLIAEEIFRPSAATQMLAMMDDSPESVRLLARNLVESEQAVTDLLQSVPEQEQMQALEIAHHYARYLAIKKKQSGPALRRRNLDLLSARSKLGAANQSTTATSGLIEPPRDDQGHLSRRVILGVGRLSADSDVSSLRLGFRPALHDVMDLPYGFKAGSQIAMGNTELQWLQGRGLRLDSLTLVDVLSLSPRGLLIRPVSWGVSAGVRRWWQPDSELFSQLRLRGGYTYDVRSSRPAWGRWFVLSDTELQLDNQFDDGGRLGSGVTVGWLRQQEQSQLWLSASWKPGLLGDERLHRHVDVHLGHRLGANTQLRMSWGWQALNDDVGRKLDLSLVKYF